jgi:hypothetical protein
MIWVSRQVIETGDSISHSIPIQGGLFMAVFCLPCGEPIEATPTTQPLRWTHPDSGTVHCAGTGVPARPDTQRLYDETVQSLDTRYTLVYPDRGDTLTPPQVQALLDGETAGEADALDDLDEWESESRWLGASAVVRDLLTAEERTLLDDAGLLQPLHEEVVDRDESDVITDLLNHSNHLLFRYDLGVDVPDYTADAEQRRDAAAEIGAATGLDAADKDGPITELLEHATFGGRLYVLWYDSPAEALRLAGSPTEQDGSAAADIPRTVTFVGAHLVVLDQWHGSGHDVRIDTLRAAWSPRKVSVDAPGLGRGWSWHDIAGPVASAYAGAFDLAPAPA